MNVQPCSVVDHATQFSLSFVCISPFSISNEFDLLSLLMSQAPYSVSSLPNGTHNAICTAHSSLSIAHSFESTSPVMPVSEKSTKLSSPLKRLEVPTVSSTKSYSNPRSKRDDAQRPSRY